MNEVNLAAATALLVEVFSDGEGLLGRFSCTEIDKLALALAHLGQHGTAWGVILGHAQDIAAEDNEEDDTHGHLVDSDTADLLPGALGQVTDHLVRLIYGTRLPGEVWGTAE